MHLLYFIAVLFVAHLDRIPLHHFLLILLSIDRSAGVRLPVVVVFVAFRNAQFKHFYTVQHHHRIAVGMAEAGKTRIFRK